MKVKKPGWIIRKNLRYKVVRDLLGVFRSEIGVIQRITECGDGTGTSLDYQIGKITSSPNGVCCKSNHMCCRGIHAYASLQIAREHKSPGITILKVYAPKWHGSGKIKCKATKVFISGTTE